MTRVALYNIEQKQAGGRWGVIYSSGNAVGIESVLSTIRAEFGADNARMQKRVQIIARQDARPDDAPAGELPIHLL